jgi:hypothetical protein
MTFDIDSIFAIEHPATELMEQDKQDWIFLHGSDLLQRSIVQGYESERRYVAERAAIEHPGFYEPAKDEYIRKTDSPPVACLKACAKYDGAYCSELGYGSPRYYVTIDNYLGSHTIVQEIRNPYRMSRSDRLYPQAKNVVLARIGVCGLGLISGLLLSSMLAQLILPPAPHPTLTPAQQRELTRELLNPVPESVPID